MKESNTLAFNVTIKYSQIEVLLNTKDQFTKESNTLASNVTMKQLKREILLNTKEYYITELNNLVCNAARNFPRGESLQDTTALTLKPVNIENSSKQAKLFQAHIKFC